MKKYKLIRINKTMYYVYPKDMNTINKQALVTKK